MTDNSKRGLGSEDMDEQTKNDIQSKGGQASSSKQDMSKLGQKGGKAAHESGNAHEFTSEEASDAAKERGNNE
jgi:general stress protein YciG